jgi:mRNA-degrading endonuclease RelE of RelBE toxin-antitoxin system
MISVIYCEEFIKQFERLPKDVKIRLIYLEELFKRDPFNHLLHVKKLKGELSSFFSFRATHDYRVVYRFISNDEVNFITVRHRKDAYKIS